MPINIISG